MLAFWCINIGLLTMVLMSLLPVVLMQAWPSVQYGMRMEGRGGAGGSALTAGSAGVNENDSGARRKGKDEQPEAN